MSHSDQVIPIRTNLIVFVILLALLFLTVGIAYIDLGVMNMVVAMTIAVIKALLIMLIFMHLRYTSHLTWIFALAAFLWLGILITLGLSDWLSRGWIDIPGK
ncbi:MAG: cytochrome C oxidase subunit IV family protein [Isosphaeraceae bacterium]|nr:cytochrome C oxidase subunit IV family protein [Isosphaeraceae bacterium]